MIDLSSRHNIEGDTKISTLDGVGGIDILPAVDIARTGQDGGWRTAQVDCSSFPVTFNIGGFVAGRKTRVVLVWHQDPDYPQYADKMSSDIDLQVTAPSGQWWKGLSYDNAYEIVEFDSTEAGAYTLAANKWRCDTSSPKYLAIAWYQNPGNPF